MILYSENESPRRGKPADYHSLPAVKRYLDHYMNYLILGRIIEKPKDAAEKRQAVREIAICEKKLAYWSRHPNFDASRAATGVTLLKSQWD